MGCVISTQVKPQETIYAVEESGMPKPSPSERDDTPSPHKSPISNNNPRHVMSRKASPSPPGSEDPSTCNHPPKRHYRYASASVMPEGYASK
jgi:hypothetical protein